MEEMQGLSQSAMVGRYLWKKGQRRELLKAAPEKFLRVLLADVESELKRRKS